MKLNLLLEHRGYGVRITRGESGTWLAQWQTKDPVLGWAMSYPKMAWRAVSEAYYASHNALDRVDAAPPRRRPSDGN